MGIRKFIGDKAFYKMAFMIILPMILQNGITNFVSLLDNIMVGRMGTEQMSGVAIVNNLMMVFNVCIWGAVTGPGIFSAQFFGRGDHKGVRYAMRFKYIVAFLCCFVAIIGFLFWDKALVSLYLNEGDSQGDVALTLISGCQYLRIMSIGLIPFALTQIYASTLRESGETLVPMKAGVTAMLVNLVGNYLLIFGHLGFPKLGVAGAAIATVVSRFVECGIVMVWTHRNTQKNPYVVGLFKNFGIPLELVKKILRKGLPLMLNEGIWAVATAMITQSYSLRGLEAVASINIANTLLGVLNVVYLSMGSSVGIIVGHLLGAGKMEEARDKDNKLIALSMATCVVMAFIFVLISPYFPQLYSTTDQVKETAKQIMRVAAVFMPVHAFINTAYFTLRSGGKTGITFVFDCGFLCVVTLPVVYLLSRFTAISIVSLYFFGQLSEMVKFSAGFILVKRGSWIQNIVDHNT